MLSQFKDQLLSNKSVMFNNFTSSTCIFTFIVLALSVSFYYYRNNKAILFNANYEYGASSTNSGTTPLYIAKVMFFHVDWCPYSLSAKKTWDTFKTQHENEIINGYTIEFIDVNCTEETNTCITLMNKYNIDGFPTIVLVKNDEVIQFDARPTDYTLSEFLKTALG